MERVETSDLRDAITDFTLVENLMYDTPQELPDNHRVRQTEIETVLKNGKVRQLICMLRDLSWKEWNQKLTATDSRLRNRVQKRIVMELAATPSMTAQIMRERIVNLIEQAMQKHQELQPQVVANA